MAQQQGNRGGNKGGQRKPPQQGQQRTGNQQLADRDWLKRRMDELFTAIARMRRAIEATLPSYITYDKFNAIVLTAVRSDPSILVCTIDSIVTACMRSAYDGLMPDKREAVILKSRNKIPGTDQWQDEARYQSMVAGLRKQILAGGQVSDVITTIVYENELRTGRFKEVRGTDPSIAHEPLPEGERGDAIAAYAVAFFHDGRRPTFEVMYKGDIYVIRDSAQTGQVWEGPYELEMWRKTVLRRFRKSLPGGNDIIDMEAREMFPQFSGDQDAAAALPAPPRPTRQAVQQRLEDQQGTEAGMQADFSSFERVKEEVDNRDRTENRENTQQDREKVESHGKSPENPKTPENPENVDKKPEKAEKVAIPADWDAWARDQEGHLLTIAETGTIDDINAFRREISPILDQAPAAILNGLHGSFADAVADFYAGSSSGVAGASGDGNGSPEED